MRLTAWKHLQTRENDVTDIRMYGDVLGAGYILTVLDGGAKRSERFLKLIMGFEDTFCSKWIKWTN